MGMNETYVTISGNVVGDPQVRMTRANVPFVTFRVASNVRRVDYKTGEYIDAGTNFVNVTAFRSLGVNLANSLEKGHPVIVYGRMRINQWTNGDRTGTTVEIDAYNVGHDLTRGQSTFVKVARPQLDQHDRLADPVVQQAGEALDGSGPEHGSDVGHDDVPDGLRLAGDQGDNAVDDAGEAVGDGADEGYGEAGTVGAGFEVEAADTDDYEVVGAAAH
jgi:single-strand DNA-binding protein